VISHGLELEALQETGYIMSDAARIAYKEAHVAGASIEESLEVARNASTTAHAAQLEKWGDLL
jgi:hypothetical protein